MAQDSSRTEWNLDELQLLYGVSQNLLQERDYSELLSTILDVTIDGLGAERGFVLLRDNDDFRAVMARNFRSEALDKAENEFSKSIAAAVMESGRALRIADALNSDGFGKNASVRALSLRSVLCAPLVNSDQAFAVIYLENRKLTNFFSERQRELLDEICALAAPRIRTSVAMQEARQRAADVQLLLATNDGVLTADEQMGRMLQTMREIASTDLPVLIQGETGTGKELVARAVYRNSARKNGKYVVLNCAAIPPSLIESELFGCVRGAFTGAIRDRIGMFASANRGTLFLDEIGEMPIELQTRLLRVLQSGEYYRVGSTQAETADVRVICATNRDLEREVAEGRFRNDLYFRISPITLKIPPLRTRSQDLRLLADHFLGLYARRIGRGPAPKLSERAWQVLSNHSFPGNVRELEGEIARLVAVTPGGTEIPAEALDQRFQGTKPEHACDPAKASDDLKPMTLEEMERRLIQSTLKHTNGNRTHAASILGITREGLRTKMQRLGLSDKGPNDGAQ